MADPLSIAGSVAGVLSLGIQVTQSLVNFYQSYEGREATFVRMTERLDSLLITLQCLDKALSERRFRADERGIIESIETSIKSCEDLILELQNEIQKFEITSSKATKAAIMVAGRRVAYPFRQSTLQKLDEDIGEIRASISAALEVLQINDNRRFQDDMGEMRALMDIIRASQVYSGLRNWLNAPDAFIDHNSACGKRHPGTGIWLVRGDQFSKWLTENNSIMWLNGFAGSGKSVLCSTAIQFALRYRGSNTNVGIAFFYFCFNDKSKQDESGMLRALLLQLSCQVGSDHVDLAQLYDRYSTGIPQSSVLLDYLRRLVERFHHVYILLDALDEASPDEGRETVLDALKIMRNWGLQSLHLFVTSRTDSDIRDSLGLSPANQVDIQNDEAGEDISNLISARLESDRKLQKWLPFREKVLRSLATRAKGIFRWVDCQLKALRSCPCSEHHLDLMLNSLPESLDQTYERMLCNINHHLIEDARRILMLLCFARRPLTVHELIDGLAVEIDNEPTGLNPKRRLQGSNGIRDICEAFIDINLGLRSSNAREHETLTETVRIAHFSVQEYLESERIQQSKAAKFSLYKARGHAEITQLCLAYLLEPGLSQPEHNLSIFKDYPLAHYAAMHWDYHFKNTADPFSSVDPFILRLFQCQNSFLTWIRLHDPDRHRSAAVDLSRPSHSIPNPIYYASLLGLDQILYDLTNDGKSESEVSKKINDQGGRFGNALQAASRRGHVQTIRILLDKGADVNAHGSFGCALQVASVRGHYQVVQILLDKGANVNTRTGGFLGSPLQAASLKGHTHIVQVLLESGADVDAQCGVLGNALQAASFGGQIQVVGTLLDSGADVNAQCGEYGNALQAASHKGYNEIVQLLLNRGANVNAEGGSYDSALRAACKTINIQLIEMLLDSGAAINARGQDHGSVLWDALVSFKVEKVELVQLLLNRGAVVSIPVSKLDARPTAKSPNRDRIVQILQKYHEAAMHRKLSVSELKVIAKEIWSMHK